MGKDLAFERWLDAQSIPFKDLGDISWDDVNVDGEISRQIRLEKGTDPDTVLRYAMEMERGVEFPNICVVEGKGDKKYDLVTGMHRMQAAQLARRDHIGAYAIDVEDPLTIDTVRRTANVLNGLDQDKEDRIQQALVLINEHGMTEAEAAERCQLPYATLSGRARANKIRTELLKQKVNPNLVSKIPATTLSDLNSIPRPKHRVLLAELFGSVKVSGIERDELLRKVKTANSDADAEQIIAEAKKQFEELAAQTGGGRYQNRRPFWSFGGVITRLERIINTWGNPDSIEKLSTNERNGLAEKAETMGEGLIALAGELRVKETNGR